MTGPAATPALRTSGLGKRYGGTWALRDCSVSVPRGRICFLVGTNGAGKSTLLDLVCGIAEPTTGTVDVLGSPVARGEGSRRVSFLDQNKPLFRSFTVDEMMRTGRELNPSWDASLARRVLAVGDIPGSARVNTLSGGHRGLVALALTLGKSADLVLLDEPLAELDPVARHEVLGLVLAEAAERELTVVISSHTLPDMDGVCDYLLLLNQGRVQLAGEPEEIARAHRRVTTVPGAEDAESADTGTESGHTVVDSWQTGRGSGALVRSDGELPPDWYPERVTAEEVVLAHMRNPEVAELYTAAALGETVTQEAEVLS
ncbi:ABC-2 type transport system ATP-binding protein [Haloactinospora alba]|uniref:ABC-2 type transport system ATP-binding protein n=1 Tax=Haloactinospora alba TaxID=405555 RepID=A0A543NK33_9ACTN|nr:ABC transporter ATP-binding protein [Haloactinospora alba]TQN32144.1 ABC-2 type transport system ATP-binding protein [Haloactinospora alba]